MYENRLERILALVKLGEPIRINDEDATVYPLLIKGRPVYGSPEYWKNTTDSANRAMVLIIYDDSGPIVSKILTNNDSPRWVDMPSKMTDLFVLAFWEKL